MSNIIQYIVPYNKPILGAKDKHFIPHTHQNYYLQVVAIALVISVAIGVPTSVAFAIYCFCQAELQLQLHFQLELSIALISFFSHPTTHPPGLVV